MDTSSKNGEANVLEQRRIFRGSQRPGSASILSLIAVLAAVACGRGDASLEATGTSRAEISSPSTPPPPPGAPPISFDLVYPPGYGVNNVAVGASEDLVLSSHDTIVATDGSPGNVTSTGTEETRIGPGARLGNIASVGRIELAPGVTALSAKSARGVKLRPHDVVGAVAQKQR